MKARLAVDRIYAAPPDRVRHALAWTLETLGLQTTRLAPGGLEARLGSPLTAGVRLTDRGVIVKAMVVGDTSTSRAMIAVEPTAATPLGSPVAQLTDYLSTAVTVLQSLDEGGATRGMEAAGTRPVLLVPVSAREFHDSALMDPQLHQLVRGQLQVLSVPDDPEYGAVSIRSPLGSVSLSRYRLAGLMDLASYVAGHADALPPGKQRSMVDLAVALWLLNQQAQQGLRLKTGPALAMNLVDAQARLRDSLAQRAVMVCRECRFERVVNTEFARITKRNRRVRNAIGTATAAVSPAATLLTVGGRLLGGVAFEPEFVCPRCQGLRPEERRGVLCPGCGQLRKEVILTTCPKAECGFDLGGSTGGHEPLLGAVPPVPVAARAPGRPSPQPTRDRSAHGTWQLDPHSVARYRWYDAHGWTNWVSD
jgi:hypothetical protein